MLNQPLMRVQTPQQVTEQRENEAKANQPPLTLQAEDAIASHVKACWSVAKQSRMPLTQRLLDCYRRRKGIYDSEKLSAIKQTGGSEIYMMLTASKVRSAKAWLSDLYNPSGDRPWALESTPIPDLPDDIKRKLVAEAVQSGVQQGIDIQTIKAMLAEHRDRLLDELKEVAEERAEKMSEKIEDILTEGDWREEFDEFLDDFVTFPYAVIKGLEFRSQKKLKWVDAGTGEFVPETISSIKPCVRRVSPFNYYPSPSVNKSLDGHWCIEHHRFTRKDLTDMRNSPGYKADKIAEVLLQYQMSGLREWMFEDGERERIEGKTHNYQSDEIDAIEFEGSLPGKWLLESGVNKSVVTDPAQEYMVSVVVIGNHTVRALINPDPSGKSDYHFTSWDPVPGAFAGNALSELMSDQQDMCNAAARALSNNMGMASGPQVWIETDRLADGADATGVWPWKVWQSSEGTRSGPGVGFFQPQSNANELMAIYERFSNYADDIVGLPKFANGSDGGAGAAKTARGLGMLMNAASKTVKQAVRNIDIRVIEPVIEKTFNYVMLFDEDKEIKGDAVPKARGSQALVHKEETAIRAREFLQASANPMDAEILDLESRHKLWREAFNNSDLPTDRILPTSEELKNRLMEKQRMMMESEQRGISNQ